MLAETQDILSALCAEGDNFQYRLIHKCNKLDSAYLSHRSRFQDIERTIYSDKASTSHPRGIVQLPAVIY